jgi:hypothetical protein
MYDILSLTNSTLLTADMILSYTKNLYQIHDSHFPFHRQMCISVLVCCYLCPIWPPVLNWTPCPESASELYWPSGRRLSAKLVSTFAGRVCHVISVTDPYGRILGFLDRSRYVFFQVAAQLYSRGWVDPVPDPLLLRKSGSSGNRTQTSGYVARNYDH